MEASTFAGSEHLAPVGLLFRPEPHSKNTEVTSLNKGSGNPKGGVRGNRDPERHEAWTQHEAEVHPSQRDGLGWPWPEAMNLLSKRVVESPAQRQVSGDDGQISPGCPEPLAVISSNLM